MGKVSFILSQGKKSLEPSSYVTLVPCWMQFKQKIMKQIFSISIVSIAEMRLKNRALENWKTLVSLDRSLSPILGDIISFRAGWMSWQDSCMGRWEIAIVYDQENFIIFYQRNVGILDSNALAIVPINFTWNIYQVPSPHFLIYLGVGGEILYKF